LEQLFPGVEAILLYGEGQTFPDNQQFSEEFQNGELVDGFHSDIPGVAAARGRN
jgi:hypothetical protein